MTKKLLSLTTALVVLYLYFLSQLQSDDALFLLKTDSMPVNIFFVLAAAAGIYISFIDKFKSWQAYLLTIITAIGLGLFGVIGFAYNSMTYAGQLGVLDYFLLQLFGVIFGICALSTNHQPVKITVPKYSFGALHRAKNYFVGLLPNTPPAQPKTLKPQLR